MAWLNAAPEVRDAKGRQIKSAPRIKRMKADGIAVEVPPLEAPYLVDWLFEAGPTSPGGMGPSILGWETIEAWARLTGRSLKPWEARILRRLSVDFLATSNEAKDPKCPAPWQPGDAVLRNREAVTDQFARMFKVAQLSQQHSQGGKTATAAGIQRRRKK